MRIRLFLLGLGLFVLSGCVTRDETAQTPGDSANGIRLPQVVMDEPLALPEPFGGEVVLHSDKPVLYRGEADAWDSSLIIPDAVVFSQGLYHMFYTGFKIALAGREISGGTGYAISTNGYDWYRFSDAPLFTWDETIGPGLFLRASSVLIDEDGTWTLYLASRSFEVGEAPSIFRATASSPNGPWVFDDVPLLEAGSSGMWDSSGVDAPVVIKDEGRFLMYYNNVHDTPRGFSAIGVATSNDGVSWEKYNDPTTDERFEESDPVFRLPEGSLSSEFMWASSVWKSTAGLSMIYTSGSSAHNNFSYATSEDGITWVASAENPVLGDEDIPSLEVITSPKILYSDDKYYIFFRGAPNRNAAGSDIYLAVAE